MKCDKFAEVKELQQRIKKMMDFNICFVASVMSFGWFRLKTPILTV